jgi:hypothetical protein
VEENGRKFERENSTCIGADTECIIFRVGKKGSGLVGVQSLKGGMEQDEVGCCQETTVKVGDFK